MPEATTAIVAYHVHSPYAPYCKSWFKEEAEQRAHAYANQYDLTVHGPYDYAARDCPYRLESEKLAAGDLTVPTSLDDEQEQQPEPTTEPTTPPEPVIPALVTPPSSPFAGAAPAAPPSAPSAPSAAPVSPPAGSTAAVLGNGSIDLSTTICDECGETLDKHSHPVNGSAPVATSVTTTTRVSRPRTNPADRPP